LIPITHASLMVPVNTAAWQHCLRRITATPTLIICRYSVMAILHFSYAAILQCTSREYI